MIFKAFYRRHFRDPGPGSSPDLTAAQEAGFADSAHLSRTFKLIAYEGGQHALKLAALCDSFGVRTAWHGPGDVSPIGHAANLHLDLSVHNFGVQEVIGFGDAIYEVFPGAPLLRDGYLWANDQPGWGIDLDESHAANYPPLALKPIEWTQSRLPDGTLWTP